MSNNHKTWIDNSTEWHIKLFILEHVDNYAKLNEWCHSVLGRINCHFADLIRVNEPKSNEIG